MGEDTARTPLKFNGLITQTLYYSREPDDHCGNLTGLGWAGLYIEGEHVHILEYCKGEGPMTRVSYPMDAESAFMTVWESLCNRYEFDHEPDSNDWVISHEGPLEYHLTPDGTVWPSVEGAIVAFAQEWIPRQEEDRPLLWFCNRRDHFELIDLDEFLNIV